MDDHESLNHTRCINDWHLARTGLAAAAALSSPAGSRCRPRTKDKVRTRPLLVWIVTRNGFEYPGEFMVPGDRWGAPAQLPIGVCGPLPAYAPCRLRSIYYHSDGGRRLRRSRQFAFYLENLRLPNDAAAPERD